MPKNQKKPKHNIDLKQPRAATIPKEDKFPRAIVTPNDNCQPAFKAEQMDLDGPWHWNNLDPHHLKDFLAKVLQSQKLSWQSLRDNGSHLVDVSKLIPTAQKRLRDIGQDDLDQLYSLRLTGIKRVWGIKEGNILWLLWWDPSHEICPSAKKHT